MKALVFHGHHDVRYESVDDPVLHDARGMIIKTQLTAICGSDLHAYHNPQAPGRPGVGMGHEFLGEVMEIGPEVTKFRPGDRVFLSAAFGCGECPQCLKGAIGSCEAAAARVWGSVGLGGGQAQAVAVPIPGHTARHIPEGVTDEQAVLLTDILPTGFYGAKNAEIKPGQSVAVWGCGPVGLMAIMSAQLFSPSRLFAIDLLPDRLKIAESLGAIPIDGNNNPVEALREQTGGLGPHACIEATGPDGSVLGALDAVRRGGIMSMVGVNMNPAFPFPMGASLMKDLTFRIGICPIPEMWPYVIPLVQSGKLHPEKIITHRMALSEGPLAYELFDRKQGGILKVVMDPSK